MKRRPHKPRIGAVEGEAGETVRGKDLVCPITSFSICETGLVSVVLGDANTLREIFQGIPRQITDFCDAGKNCLAYTQMTEQ